MPIMEEQIVPADRKLRKQVLTWCVLLVLLAIFGVHSVLDHLDQAKKLADSSPELAFHKIRNLLMAMRLLNLAVSLAFALYFASIAWKTFRSGRYPPQGMRVIRDTPIQTGSRAKFAGATCLSAAIFLLSTNFILWHLETTVEKLARP